MSFEVLSHCSNTFFFSVLLASGFGLPFPEEFIFVMGGFASNHGHSGVILSLLLGSLGTLVIDAAIFFTARRFGNWVLHQAIFSRFFNRQRQDTLQGFFTRYGSWVVFFARYLAGLQVPAFFLAGTEGMQPWRFLVLDALGLFIGAFLLFWVGYFFANYAPQVEVWFQVMGGLGLLLFLLLAWRYTKHRRIQSTNSQKQLSIS